MTIAKTILSQMGGGQFIAMTGAKCMDCGNALGIKFPGNHSKDGINYLKITLTAADDYTMEFGKIRAMKYTVKKTVEGAYCDQIRGIFESTTGLRTSLTHVYS